MRPTGYLSVVLHAHLPFVRHPEYPSFLEEDWLFEAITETYIPLLRMMDRLWRDGVDFRLTMSLTPPLCEMLADELLQSRYLEHVGRLTELAQRVADDKRGTGFEDAARPAAGARAGGRRRVGAAAPAAPRRSWRRSGGCSVRCGAASCCRSSGASRSAGAWRSSRAARRTASCR